MNSTQTGADWRLGYETALDYTAGLYPHLHPDHLNYVCALHGVEAATQDVEYNYFELGCGRAATVGALAASNPRARFYANDFMPSQVAEGRARACDAGLHNLTLLERSFEELAEGETPLPEFDYITMQGVYTWVAPEVRGQIVRFINRHLKPGGVVSVGYNALPGWAANMPVQRLMRASSQWSVGTGEQRVESARSLMQVLLNADAEIVKDCAAMQRRLTSIATASPAYLQHEYLNGHWHPLYHADVAEEFAGAKLDFVGSAVLPMFGMTFPPHQQALLDAIPDPRWRETAKDYLMGSSFRTDVFVRGRRAVSASRRQVALDAFNIALTVPVSTALQRLAEKNAHLAETFRPVIARIAERPCRLQELASRDMGPDLIHMLAAMLSMNRHACIFGGDMEPESGNRTTAWNETIANDALQGSSCTVLASPLTRCGVDAHRVALALIQQLIDQPGATPDVVTAGAVGALAGAAGDQTLWQDRVLRSLEIEVPVWRALGVV